MEPGRHRRVVVWLFAVAAISAAWQSSRFPGPGFGSYWETVAVARHLAAGDGFSNPYGTLDTGPTAHLAPAFPAMLALLIRIFGDTPRCGVAAIALSVLAHALYCVLFVPLSAILFGDRRPGIWAAAFSAVVPTIHMLPQWEAIYAAVGAQLFCLASARLVGSRMGAWAAGGMCGALLLLNPMLITVAAVWFFYLRPPARGWFAFAAAACLVCVPWTVRNYRQFGTVVLIRDNLGAELYLSNADCADARDAVNQVNGCHVLLQPNASVRESTAIREQGEVAYNRSRMIAAGEWIHRHRAQFIQLTLRRVREFWCPTAETVAIYEYSRWLVTILSAIGLGLLIRERHRAALFLGVAMAIYPIVYYIIQASTRYRSPVLWISVLPAAFAVSRCVAMIQTSARSSPRGVPVDAAA
jgi:hypothetical protein